MDSQSILLVITTQQRKIGMITIVVMVRPIHAIDIMFDIDLGRL